MIWDFITMFRTIKKNDPTLKNPLELLLYPCFWAISFHRIAHFLFKLKIPLLPRIISQLSRLMTGIEIHPGAKMGRGIFIDHGIGVVIGETAKVGNNCIMFHGVTLGSKGGSGLSKTFRHPQVGNNVLLGTGSKLIGPITIGDGTKIGVNAIVTRDVQPKQILVSPKAIDLNKQNIPLCTDIAQIITDLQAQVQTQQHDIKQLKEQLQVFSNMYRNNCNKILSAPAIVSSENSS